MFRDVETHNVDPQKIFELLIKLRESFLKENVRKFAVLAPRNVSTPLFLFKEIVKYIFMSSLIIIEIHNPEIQEIDDAQIKNEILKASHESLIAGHSGIKRTLHRIRLNYYWRNMKLDIQTFINACVKCNQNKSKVKTQAPMRLTSSSDYAFQKLYVDIVGKLPASGEFEYLLTIKDDLTGFVIAVPIVETSSETIARNLVEKVFMIFGFPQIIICDNAANLNSELMKKLYKLTKSLKINVTAYRPQGNSVERFHKDLGPYLRNFIENKHPWADLIQYATFSHNSSNSEVR